MRSSSDLTLAERMEALVRYLAAGQVSGVYLHAMALTRELDERPRLQATSAPSDSEP